MAASIYERYRHTFAEALAHSLGVPLEEVAPQVKAAEPAHGDFAFVTFPLAKVQKKAPPAIATQLAAGLRVPGVEISAAGPYVNARISAEPFTQEVLSTLRREGLAYGGSNEGVGKTIVIDYSSPNIAKPIAYHHIRTTVLGHSLVNLYRHHGHPVVGLNYLGDWGKQFGLVALGLSEFGDASRKAEPGHLVQVYVKANALAEKDPAFDERARAFFRRMEANEPEALALWRELRALSIEDFKKVYARLGIVFDSYDEGEARYQGKMDVVIDQIARTVGVKESQGALIVDMPYEEGEPPVLLKKADGSTLYATRDLASAIDRWERFHFERSLYVVASDQALHFRQFFSVLKRMGMPWADRMVHVNFGRIHGMSTRKGEIVLFTDVIDEARARAREKVRENQEAGRIHTQDPEALAEQVGVGAIVFGDLKNRRTTDYAFDWEEVLSFEGHSGPYLQYAHARACNLLVRGEGAPKRANTPRLALPEEQLLVRALSRFPSEVRAALEENEPSYIARHLLEIAAQFSRWYTLGNQDREKRVVVEGDPELRAARLALADGVRITLATGLKLLGVPAPENM
jgi:arginyl-tRNA synthetase